MFHLLPFTGCVLSILFDLLLLAVKQILLLHQFFLHVGEHLEELAFVNRRQVDVSDSPAKAWVSSIMGPRLSRGIISPTVATDLPLEAITVDHLEGR